MGIEFACGSLVLLLCGAAAREHALFFEIFGIKKGDKVSMRRAKIGKVLRELAEAVYDAERDYLFTSSYIYEELEIREKLAYFLSRESEYTNARELASRYGYQFPVEWKAMAPKRSLGQLLSGRYLN